MSLRRRLLLSAVPATAAALLGSRWIPAAQPRIFRVSDYGAKGDGLTLDTSAIQAAIDAAAASGGTVVFNPGVYLTGSLFLKSGVTFRVDAGVRLLGTHDLTQYPTIQTRVAGIEMQWPAALLNVYRQQRVQILGEGEIDGDGKVFWDSYWNLRRDYDGRGLRWAADYDCRRPRLVHFYEASGVTLRGLHLTRSGFWTLHVCYSNDVHIADVVIRNNEGGRGPSTDGIDIDSSRKVLVERADISCNDDALCIKAGRDSDGLRVARPTEDVVIRDCVVRDAAAGITFGSETSGGFRRIEVSGLQVFHPTPIGVLFKSAHTRGGRVQDIRIRDVRLRDVATVLRINLNWNPSYSYAAIPPGVRGVPPYWHVLATPVPRDRGLPHLSDVELHNVAAIGAQEAFDVAAYPEAPLQRFRFEGLDLQARSAGHISDARDWTFRESKLRTDDGKPVQVTRSANISAL